MFIKEVVLKFLFLLVFVSIQRINKTKSWFFEKINKLDKSLAKLTEREWDISFPYNVQVYF